MKYSSYFFIILACLFLVGCGSQKTVVKQYYMIEQPKTSAQIDSLQKPAIDAWCEVEKTEVYPAFDSRRIVFRDNTNQIRYYGNHEWAVRPSDALTPFIIDYLSEKNVFTRISNRFWEKAPSYRIESTIFNIEVGYSEERDFEARLSLRFDLIDSDTDKIIISHQADRASVLEDKNLNLMAAAVSNIFQEELESFANSIIEKLAKSENK